MFAGLRRTFCCAFTVFACLCAAPAKAGKQDSQGKYPENARQIATLDGVARKGKTHAAPARGDRQPLASELGSLKKSMPRDLQDAADRSCQAARDGMHLAAARLDQAGKWLAHIVAQMNSIPVATPAGSPYVTKSDRHLRLMPDGRLKTVLE